MAYIIGLYISGAILTFVEIFFPGLILGTMGVICYGGAVWLSFVKFGSAGAGITFFIILLTVIAEFYYVVRHFPDSKIGKMLSLRGSVEGVAVSEEKKSDLLGKTGKAITDLRPAGIVVIDGKRYDVVSDTDYIEKGSEVRVVDVKGLKILVRKQ